MIIHRSKDPGRHEQLTLSLSIPVEPHGVQGPDSERIRRLAELVDRIRVRHGAHAVHWGRPIVADLGKVSRRPNGSSA